VRYVEGVGGEEGALSCFVVEDVEVHVLEDDCAVDVVGDVAMDDPEVRPLAVEQELTPAGVKPRQPQQDFTRFGGFVRVDIGGIILRLHHGKPNYSIVNNNHLKI
jgi:hypothetical protein